MKFADIRKKVLGEMEVASLSERQEGLLDALFSAYENFEALGYDGGRLISRSEISMVIPRSQRHLLEARDDGYPDPNDKYLKSVLVLVISSSLWQLEQFHEKQVNR